MLTDDVLLDVVRNLGLLPHFEGRNGVQFACLAAFLDLGGPDLPSYKLIHKPLLGGFANLDLFLTTFLEIFCLLPHDLYTFAVIN